MRFLDQRPEENALLEQTLANFKRSVHAWSEAEYSRPHEAARVYRHTNWRLAAGLALGCVLAAGSVAGGVYERHYRQELAKIAAAARAAKQQKLAAFKSASQTGDEDLLAKVDSDGSREVPSAMEPLAQLMAEGDAK
jgi:hypothetical protein